MLMPSFVKEIGYKHIILLSALRFLGFSSKNQEKTPEKFSDLLCLCSSTREAAQRKGCLSELAWGLALLGLLFVNWGQGRLVWKGTWKGSRSRISSWGCSYFLLLLGCLATISKPELLEQDGILAHCWHSRKIIQRSNLDQLQMCLTSARKQNHLLLCFWGRSIEGCYILLVNLTGTPSVHPASLGYQAQDAVSMSGWVEGIWECFVSASAYG